MEEILRPISGHAILILLVQLAGLLVLARVLAEGMRRIGQPEVLGELLAGILVGPTVLGHFAPELFSLAFPQDEEQFHLLEVVSWLGMVMLLLLTGLETDIRAMRNLGRAALMASVFGMVVPFASGFVLGWWLPDAFLTDPANRPIFAAFLGTAMAISAMPVIAKILMDLDLLRRSVGMVILSAAVVDDTTGWLVLSIIAGIAAGGTFSPVGFGITLLWLAIFLVVMRWVAYPALRRAVQYVNERVDLAGGDITLILAFTFLAAAATEAMGIHAVFGAFVAGLLIRQIPRVGSRSIETLEVFVLSALAPVFFAFVGLRVDLWALSGWELPALVIGVAIFGKLAGCYLGGRLGRLSHWESLAVGFGMNARGAMELIVALIGLSLGLLTQEMYSTIVMVAVVTSFMAPLLLRWAVPKLPLREEERQRLEEAGPKPLIPTGPRVLVPTAGGESALTAMRFAAPLVRRGQGQLTALYVDMNRRGSRRLLPPWRRASLAGTNLDAHLSRAQAVVNREGDRFSVRRVRSEDVAEAVLRESTRDYDLLLIGAAPERALNDPLALRIVRSTSMPVVIVRPRRADFEGRPTGGSGTDLPNARANETSGEFSHVLVPVDGSIFSRYAAELALAYAGAAGADVRILHVLNQSRLAWGAMPVGDAWDAHELRRGRIDEIELQIQREFGPLAASYGARISIRILSSGAPGEIIIGESRSGSYDLLVLGAEDKIFGRPLFFGQGTAEIVERTGCTTAIILPGVEQARER